MKLAHLSAACLIGSALAITRAAAQEAAPPPTAGACAAAADPADCLLKKLDTAERDGRVNHARADFLRKRITYTRRQAQELQKTYADLDAEVSRARGG